MSSTPGLRVACRSRAHRKRCSLLVGRGFRRRPVQRSVSFGLAVGSREATIASRAVIFLDCGHWAAAQVDRSKDRAPGPHEPVRGNLSPRGGNI